MKNNLKKHMIVSRSYTIYTIDTIKVSRFKGAPESKWQKCYLHLFELYLQIQSEDCSSLNIQAYITHITTFWGKWTINQYDLIFIKIKLSKNWTKTYFNVSGYFYVSILVLLYKNVGSLVPADSFIGMRQQKKKKEVFLKLWSWWKHYSWLSRQDQMLSAHTYPGEDVAAWKSCQYHDQIKVPCWLSVSAFVSTRIPLIPLLNSSSSNASMSCWLPKTQKTILSKLDDATEVWPQNRMD